MAGVTSVGSLRRLAASVLALGRIRLELLGIEWQEEKQRVAALLFWAVLAALAVGFATVFVSIALTLWLWDTHRELVVGLAAVAWVALAAWSMVRLRALASAPSTLLKASVGELRRDEAALRGVRVVTPAAAPSADPVPPAVPPSSG